jgi:hypothetical protein
VNDVGGRVWGRVEERGDSFEELLEGRAADPVSVAGYVVPVYVRSARLDGIFRKMLDRGCLWLCQPA